MVNHPRRRFLKFGGLAAGTVLGGFLIDRAKARAPALLRPPGAGSRSEFLASCIRCGQCVEACPTQILRPAAAHCHVAAGTPYLIAREKPCDLCQGRAEMECIATCPTAALQPVAGRREVRMGVAEIDRKTCLAWNSVVCKACWHACPFPNEAILFGERGHPMVDAEACVGCGLCEHACLTEIPAIAVKPGGDLDSSTEPSRSR